MQAQKTSRETGSLMVNVFDGTRQPIKAGTKLLIRIIDGNQREVSAKNRKGPSVLFEELPCYDNYGDNYTVIVSADNYHQVGFQPIKISRGILQHIDLMLLPKNASFNFGLAQWETLKNQHHKLFEILSQDLKNDSVAKDRYNELIEGHPESLACFFNITETMTSVHLPMGYPLDYLSGILWDEIKQDRFFGYAEEELIQQVEKAANQGIFAPEIGCGFFHPGATKSYKQIQFSEANLQITFHEGDTRKIAEKKCVKVELDIDYYKDNMAHAFLEVFPNTFTGRLTDPRQVYVLRWIAGRRAGIPAFNPPYEIV